MSNYVGVIGYGSFGKTIVKLLSCNTNVMVYVRNPSSIDFSLVTDQVEEGTEIHDLKVAQSLEELCKTCKVIFPVIPSTSLRNLAKRMSPFLNPSHYLIHAIKGLDYQAHEDLTVNNIHTMSQVLAQETNCVRIGCMSGPNLSKEIFDNQPTGTVVASEFDEVITLGKELLTTKRFVVFGSHHLLGTELAGAFKNIIAVGSGVLSGKGYGKNLQSMLITRGLHEIIQLGKYLGADSEAFLGIAGIGDVIATSTSINSRNFRLGKMISEGVTLDEATESLGEVAEGVNTLKILHQISTDLKLSLPISNMIYYIVHEGYPLEKALDKLVFYPAENDVDF